MIAIPNLDRYLEPPDAPAPCWHKPDTFAQFLVALENEGPSDSWEMYTREQLYELYLAEFEKEHEDCDYYGQEWW